MTSAPTTIPETAAQSAAAARVSYWQVVLGQLRKNRVAMFAWRMVQGLLLVAVGAPLLSFNLPLLHISAEGPRTPLLSGLFDRTLFEGGVDLFFNVLLLAFPPWMLARRLAVRREDGTAAWRPVRLVLLAVVVGVELFAALHGRTAIRLVVLGVVVPGTALLAFASRTGRPTPRAARLACLALLTVGVLTVLRGPEETSLPLVWRGPSASVHGTMVFPPVPHHPNAVGEPEARERARAHPDGSHWLGCDLNGRDVVTRIVFGSRISVTIGLVGVSIYILIGTLLGSLAGYYSGKVDLLIMRLVEIMICFPTMFLLLTIIAVFESRSIFLIMAAIGFVGWPGVTRLVRGEFLRQRNFDYVTAARALGLKERRVIFRHVLPNCVGPVLVSATFGIAGAILTESSIAFLGLGDQTSVSWGQMLTTGRSSQEWHLILVPGFAIFFVVTVFNLLGEGLRDALDPKLRR